MILLIFIPPNYEAFVYRGACIQEFLYYLLAAAAAADAAAAAGETGVFIEAGT